MQPSCPLPVNCRVALLYTHLEKKERERSWVFRNQFSDVIVITMSLLKSELRLVEFCNILRAQNACSNFFIFLLFFICVYFFSFLFVCFTFVFNVFVFLDRDGQRVRGPMDISCSIQKRSEITNRPLEGSHMADRF